ncbi:hypothetical protein CFP56_005964 [Quercus suber]|uniref:Secreted protein n=1 Tax=Quercus suber TaxID=58331 RepID=A0AAW0M7K8_QUESU
MARLSWLHLGLFLIVIISFSIGVLHSVQAPVTIGVQKHIIRSLVYSTATNAVTNVCAFPRAHMETRKNVHATTTGKLRRVGPSAHEVN